MARPREPIDLIKAKGRKHLTEEEYEERKESEIEVPFVNVQPPSYLKKKQKEKFMDIADKLLAIGIMTELDVDMLAMYILSHDLYLSYTKTIAQFIKINDIAGLKDVQNMQDKAFRQAHTAARALGLTITDRCRIVIPIPPDNDDDEL
jgi:P27 family predicted phage terminase small subunit